MSVAHTVAPLLESVLGEDPPIRVRCWDGSELGSTAAAVWVWVSIKNRRALRWLLWAPNEVGLARAYVDRRRRG